MKNAPLGRWGRRTADDLPEKKRRKRKNQVVLADNDTDTEETELSNRSDGRLQKEEQLIEELEADAEEHPFEDGTDEEEPERKKLKRNCGQKPLHDWRIPPEHSGSLKMWLHGGTGWTLIGSVGNAIMNSAEAATMFLLIMGHLPMNSFSGYAKRCTGKADPKGRFHWRHFLLSLRYPWTCNGRIPIQILWELNEEHKELLFSVLSGCLAQQGSPKYGIKATGTSARCVARCSKIQKKLLPALLDKAEKQQPMTLLEKNF